MENNLLEALTEFAEAVISDIRNNMGNYGLENGNLANSITYTVSDENNGDVKIYADNYWKFAQEGRGPGGTPYNFEDIIKEWAARRGIGTEDQDRFARAVNWKTRLYGSYIYRHPSEKRDFIQDAVENNMKILQDKIGLSVEKNFLDAVKEFKMTK